MKEAGSALMSIGEASGENRAIIAAKSAISSPLLDLSIEGAKGVLFVISGGQDLSMTEIKEITDVITNGVSEDVKIIFGANIDDNFKDKVRVTLVATGFGEEQAKRQETAKNNFGYRLNKIFLEQDNNKDEEVEEIKINKKVPGQPQIEKIVKIKPLVEEKPVQPTFKERTSFFHSQPVVKSVDEEEEEERVETVRQPLSFRRQEAEPDDYDEDLEIPPFLRKKMK